MAHFNQQQFCLKVKAQLPQHFIGSALDVGSLDINGNNRHLFSGTYIGLDVGAGPNVDVISFAHRYKAPSEAFDCIISTETFEHDPFFADSIRNIIRMLKPGGLFLFTCATNGREEHGTRRTSPDNTSSALLILAGDYYKNIGPEDLSAIPGFFDAFEPWQYETNMETCDLYFWGIKK